jgi:hypothetical protein
MKMCRPTLRSSIRMIFSGRPVLAEAIRKVIGVGIDS